MPSGSKDDFSAFAGKEHMFFGLSDPFGFIRNHAQEDLSAQVEGSVLESIVTRGEPRFLTIGRGGEEQLRVTYFAFCVQTELTVTHPRGTRFVLDATVTFMFGELDQPGAERSRSYFDLEGDAPRGFDDEVFRERFLGFRHQNSAAPRS